MAGNYKIEHVARTPRGWKVRTVTQGDHQVRIAFPPGRRETGSGHVVEILHPLHENPSYCPAKSRMTNPAELVLMGANPHGRRRMSARRHNQVELAPILTDVGEYAGGDIAASEVEKEIDRKHRRQNRHRVPVRNAGGRYAIRWHTGNISHAMRTEAEARKLLREFHGAGEIIRVNPMPLRKRNPSGTDTAEAARNVREGFTASPSNRCTVMDEPHIPAGDYAEIGPLVSLSVKPVNGGEVKHLALEGRKILAIVAASRRQIYFAGGDQELSDDDLSRIAPGAHGGVILLGDCREIVYLAKKYHPEVGNSAAGKTVEWEHEFGEEDGILPALHYDETKSRLILRGGNYRVEDAGIIN